MSQLLPRSPLCGSEHPRRRRPRSTTPRTAKSQVGNRPRRRSRPRVRPTSTTRSACPPPSSAWASATSAPDASPATRPPSTPTCKTPTSPPAPDAPATAPPTPGQDPTAVINAAVYQAFREVPLPQTVLHIQPPDGTTLVNLETNFFTTTQPFTTTVTVLGYTVELDITPTTYTWDFGDGTTTTTTTPGAPYPDLDITHVYTRTGTYPTTLTTTWSADFRVDGRDWQRVQGTVDMPSPTLDLQVREATPVLTG
ncbi:PKD domain-containing protein [Nocardioides zeae]|uniref:PKD domain-containing protein n=1 Tax=Nocardioides zeae TaxID=1457234 RepID=UPI0027D87520|nr:PKD domain-containing protein [Nocardioides zeae]